MTAIAAVVVDMRWTRGGEHADRAVAIARPQSDSELQCIVSHDRLTVSGHFGKM